MYDLISGAESVFSADTESRQHVCRTMLGLLASFGNGYPSSPGLVAVVTRLAESTDRQGQACDVLLGLLKKATHPDPARDFIAGLVTLAIEPSLAGRVRAELLEQLAAHPAPEVVPALARGVAQIAPADEDCRRSATTAFIRCLAAIAEDRRETRDRQLQLLAEHESASGAAGLPQGVILLSIADERTREAARALLPDPRRFSEDRRLVESLIDGLVDLAPGESDKDLARRALLAWLALLTDSSESHLALSLTWAISVLNPTAGEVRQARSQLCWLLENSLRWPTPGHVVVASGPVRVAQLFRPASPDHDQAGSDHERSEAYLRRCAAESFSLVPVVELAEQIADLGTTQEDRLDARDLLLDLMTTTRQADTARGLARKLLTLEPTEAERQKAFSLIIHIADAWPDAISLFGGFAEVVAQLCVTAEDAQQAASVLFLGLNGQHRQNAALEIVSAIASLAVCEKDRKQFCDQFLRLLADSRDDHLASALIAGIDYLTVSEDDRLKARNALRRLLAVKMPLTVARNIQDAINRLDGAQENEFSAPTYAALLRALEGTEEGPDLLPLLGQLTQLELQPREKRQVLDTLICRFRAQGLSDWDVSWFYNFIKLLDPTARDLHSLNLVKLPSAGELLAAARRNSTFTDWIDFLPSQAHLSSR